MNLFNRSKLLGLGALLTAMSGQAMAQPPTVNAVVGVSSGALSLSVTNANPRFFFVPTAPGVPTSPAALELPLLQLTDARTGDQIGYSVTVQTTDFVGPGGNTIDSETNWRLTGTPVASVTQVAGSVVPPAPVAFGSATGFEASAQTIVRQDPFIGGTNGQGTYEAALNASSWQVTVPNGTANGVYNGTVTFTILPNP